MLVFQAFLAQPRSGDRTGAAALQTGRSLVYEVDVRTPNLVGRNPQNINVVIFLWVPRQPVV